MWQLAVKLSWLIKDLEQEEYEQRRSKSLAYKQAMVLFDAETKDGVNNKQ
jgi:hypothetical protein